MEVLRSEYFRKWISWFFKLSKDFFRGKKIQEKSKLHGWCLSRSLTICNVIHDCLGGWDWIPWGWLLPSMMLSCLMRWLVSFCVLKDKNLSLLKWFLIASIMDTEPKTIGSEWSCKLGRTNPIEKHACQIGDHSPQFWGNRNSNKQSLRPTNYRNSRWWLLICDNHSEDITSRGLNFALESRILLQNTWTEKGYKPHHNDNVWGSKSTSRWFKVTFLGCLSDPFKGLSDLQLGG